MWKINSIWLSNSSENQKESWQISWEQIIWETRDLVDSRLHMKSRNLDYKKSSEKIILQLKKYLLDSKQKWFVVWISGWVDSALVSTLCAMTWEQTILLELPIHQNLDEVSRAWEHISNLESRFTNVKRFKIDLTTTFETFKEALPEIDDEIVRYMAYINSRSRLRTVTLYAIWNEYNFLVVWTWNRVEDFGIWFFTKYWDGAVDVSPIWNLYKSEVYKMAENVWVVKSVLDAIPTDWLHTNWATDEEQIWCSYDELEWAMEEFEWYKYDVIENYWDPYEKII